MLLKNPDAYPIQPWDIKTDRVLVGAFGRFEMEYTARLIVLHSKLMEGWRPFSHMELQMRFPEEYESPNFNLNMLAARKFIVEMGCNKYQVSEAFVDKCHQVSITSQGS
jgi:hypothetical protein